MKRFFRWQFWRWRYHYWRRRAVLAERQLEAETARNREREGELVTAPLRTAGLFAPRAHVASPERLVRPTSTALNADPLETWTWADRQEFDLYWKPDAEAAGVPMRQAKQRFHDEVILPRRQPLNDDPYSVN